MAAPGGTDVELDTSRRTVDAVTFRGTLGNLGAAVAVVTSGQGEARDGLTLTALCPLPADPPGILVCVERDAGVRAALVRTKSFAVNYLLAGQAGIARAFARHGDAAARFAPGGWTTLTTGAPVFVNSLASLDCELTDLREHGTHSVVTGSIVNAVRRSEGEPLMDFRGQFARLVPFDLSAGLGEKFKPAESN